MTRLRRTLIGLSVGILMPLTLGTGPAAQAAGRLSSTATVATTAHHSVPDPNFSLTVSPTRLEVAPAEIGRRHQIKVINGGSTPMPVTVQLQNFVARADGSLAFQTHAPYEASSWVTVSPASFVLAPGATQIVTASIAMPTAPEPGDHMLAVVFLVPAGQTDANIKINRGIGAPVYITVPGPIVRSASLGNLDTGWFTQGGPVTITATVSNTGTVHQNFRGSSALNIDGAGTAVPFPDFTVMRDSTRDISTTWNPPLICICHPTVSLIGADGQLHSQSVRVIVFPLTLFVTLLGGLLIVALLTVWLRRRYHTMVRREAALLGRPQAA
jgi:hypothetical protein